MKTKILTRDDVLNKYSDYLTIGQLKEHIKEYNLPDHAKVVIQRVEDIYFEKHGWGVLKKESDLTYKCKEWNKELEKGKEYMSENYPNIKEGDPHLIPHIEEEMDEYKI